MQVIHVFNTFAFRFAHAWLFFFYYFFLLCLRLICDSLQTGYFAFFATEYYASKREKTTTLYVRLTKMRYPRNERIFPYFHRKKTSVSLSYEFPVVHYARQIFLFFQDSQCHLHRRRRRSPRRAIRRASSSDELTVLGNSGNDNTN